MNGAPEEIAKTGSKHVFGLWPRSELLAPNSPPDCLVELK